MKTINLILTFMILGVVLYFFLSYMHEKVHEAIFDSYDIPSKIHLVKEFPDFATSVSTLDYKEKCNDNCKLAHNINEAVGYPAMAIFLLLFFGFLYVLVFLSRRRYAS